MVSNCKCVCVCTLLAIRYFIWWSSCVHIHTYYHDRMLQDICYMAIRPLCIPATVFTFSANRLYETRSPIRLVLMVVTYKNAIPKGAEAVRNLSNEFSLVVFLSHLCHSQKIFPNIDKLYIRFFICKKTLIPYI